MPNDDSPDQEPKRAKAAAAAAGGHDSLWARQGRAALQGSHSLTEPLARWAPELVESEMGPSPDGAAEQEIAIPQAVLQPRPPQRLPEDSMCRSPIAGLVIAVMATPGTTVARHQPVLVIEAMKMQNNVSPEVDGVVKAVHVAPGDAVKAGQILFELF
jgi:biotin carboxyl carrier protein